MQNFATKMARGPDIQNLYSRVRLVMFYHINAFKQTNKKKYQLDFALEGDLDMIKDWLTEKEIITLGITQITDDMLANIGSIHATIFHHADQQEHKLITHHKNIAQACLLLVFLGFDVRAITDTQSPLSSAQSDKLIALVHDKIQQQQTKKHKEETDNPEKKQFEDEKLLKLRNIAQETQQDITQLKEKASTLITPAILKNLDDLQNNLQKYARGTNANKISVTLKQAFNLMEEIELHLIDDSKEEEIRLIKNSLISNVDILNEYNKRQKAEHIKKVGEKSTNPDDKFYLFFGKIGIYTRFLKKEFLHKVTQGNYITKAIVKSINHVSIMLPLLCAVIIIRSHIQNGQADRQLLILSHIGIYAGLWTIRSSLTPQRTTLTLMGIPIVIGVGYFFSLIIYNTFAL